MATLVGVILQLVKMNLTKLYLVLTALAVLLLPELSFAQEKLSDQLCELRQMFCGAGGGVLMAVAITTVGITTFSGRIHWSFALTITAALVMFIKADWIADMFIDGVVLCTCI